MWFNIITSNHGGPGSADFLSPLVSYFRAALSLRPELAAAIAGRAGEDPQQTHRASALHTVAAGTARLDQPRDVA